MIEQLAAWANRHSIPQAAYVELLQLMGTQPTDPSAPKPAERSEAAAQQEIRLESARRGARLWRNNNGACKAEDGRLVRYGLANDSAQSNRVFKSSDLIGIWPYAVQPGDVGRMLGVFTAIEVKRPGWRYANTEREQAQLAFINFILANGGFARFATGAKDI